jgi:hypothetical protein
VPRLWPKRLGENIWFANAIYHLQDCNSASCSCCPFSQQLPGIECSTTVTPFIPFNHTTFKVLTGTGRFKNTLPLRYLQVPVGSRTFRSTLDLPLSWQSLRGLSMQQRRSAQHDRIGAGARTRGESNPTSDAASRLSNHHPGDPASARSPGIIVMNFQTRTL